MSVRTPTDNTLNLSEGDAALRPDVAARQFLDWLSERRSTSADGQRQRIIVAYSGGVDSHVLLHALVQALNTPRAAPPDAPAAAPWSQHFVLRALHVDHQLQSQSTAWAEHCAAVCSELGVPLQTRQIPGEEITSLEAEQGLEAAARLSRYRVFNQVMLPGDVFVLAQHADDQAETFLLQALRGSGPDGLAAIPFVRDFGRGSLCRPLLTSNRVLLQRYAEEHRLQHVEDPSNLDMRYDRNYLRHEILPRLTERWPAHARTLSRSAARCGAARQLLMNLARADLLAVRDAAEDRLLVERLASLGRERCFNVLRLWVREAGLPLPRLRDLQRVSRELVTRRDSAASSHYGQVDIANYQFRRYRNHLYLLRDVRPAVADHYVWRTPFAALEINEAAVTVTLEELQQQGLELPADAVVRVQNRRGGEMIRLGVPGYHKSVKKLMQEHGVPPWQRESLPLIYVNDTLAAVWRLAVAGEYASPATDHAPAVVEID